MPMLLPPPLLLLLLPTHDALPIQELKNFLKLLYSLSTKKKIGLIVFMSNFSHEIFQSGLSLPLPLSESHIIWTKLMIL
jgi:hypothetical protein